MLTAPQALRASLASGCESGATDSHQSAGSEPCNAHQFSGRARSEYENNNNKKIIFKASNVDELKGAIPK